MRLLVHGAEFDVIVTVFLLSNVERKRTTFLRQTAIEPAAVEVSGVPGCLECGDQSAARVHKRGVPAEVCLDSHLT